MSLRYILGASGYGKTRYCIDNMLSDEGSNKTYIYIVPEQFSLESEKALILNSSQKSLINIQVLSFKRLAFHILSQTGALNKPLLSDEGKTMLLRRLAGENLDKLCYFKKSIDKQGFLDALSTTISEFFRYGISYQRLSEVLEDFEDGTVLNSKLKDISLLYKLFCEFIEQKYIPTDEILDILADEIPNSKILENSEIYIDGFNGFTPQEYKVILKLLHKSDRVNVALTSVSGRTDLTLSALNPYDTFFEVQKTIVKLNSLCADNGIAVEKPHFLDKNFRHANSPALAFLEKHYGTYSQEVFENEANNIHISAAPTIQAEVNMACARIFELIYSKGYRYEDIAIITTDSGYEQPLKRSLSDFGIPFFLDSRKSIASHPLTELIESLTEVVSYSYSPSAVIRLLKTQMLGIPYDDIAMFENFMLAYGIKGWQFTERPWSYNVDVNTYDLERINEIKGLILEATAPLFVKEATVDEMLNRLFEVLKGLDIEKTISDWYDKAKNEGDDFLASEHTQIYPLIVSIFKKLSEIMGDLRTEPKEFSKLLLAGLAGAKMGLIPPSQDEILIGSTERTRLGENKAVFIMGAAEGLLPLHRNDAGIFSDLERQALTDQGFELAASCTQKICQEAFSIYTILTNPTEHLFISYAVGSGEDSKTQPSPVIQRIRSLFPALRVTDYQEFTKSEMNLINSPIPSFRELSERISHFATDNVPLSEDFISVYRFFVQSDKYRPVLDRVENGIFSSQAPKRLSEKSARALYGTSLKASVSKLESYNQCPFSFFLSYGLRAKERSNFEVDPLNMGTAYHTILEKFGEYLTKNALDWRSLTDEDIEQIIREIAEEELYKDEDSIFLSDNQSRYFLKRILDTSIISIKALSKQIKLGLFNPIGYEIGFGEREALPPIVIELEDGRKIVLSGKIDRIDILDDKEQKYVKITDYKSGTQSYDETRIYYGLQMQLVLYLDAYIKIQKQKNNLDLLPAGIFYFKVKNPIVKLSDAKDKDFIFNELRAEGLTLENEAVLSAFGSMLEQKQGSYANEAVNKTKSASLAEFERLRRHISYMVRTSSADILDGRIEASPFKLADKTGCDYCPYSAVCKKDLIPEDKLYHRLRKIGNIFSEIE